MPSFEEDFAWQEKFRPHFSEIAKEALRVDVAPPEDDWKRNTDFLLSVVIPLPKRDIRVSARARRHEYINRYRGSFTVRLDRPSGQETEMPKLRAGWGDVFIYGFESEPESDRLGPWFVGNSQLLRKYIAEGGYYSPHKNKDGSSRLAAFHHEDMPLGFVIKGDGIPDVDRYTPWATCHNPNWTDPARPRRNGMCNGSYVIALDDIKEPGTGYWRRCLSCGFTWRAGWEMPHDATIAERMRTGKPA